MPRHVAKRLDCAVFRRFDFRRPASLPSLASVTAFSAASRLAAAPATNQCQLILHGVQGNLYTVMVGTNLTNWSSLVPSILLTNPIVPFLDTNVVPGNRFYRLRGS
jgi:hypothetical protein